jgi:hypothetical protein
MDPAYDEHLINWYNAGLTTICLSAVHYRQEENQKIYGKKYPDIRELVAKLHKIGYTVRLSVMLLKGFIDNYLMMYHLLGFCRAFKISQLTMRPIDNPSSGCEQSEFVDKHTLEDREWQEIKNSITDHATPILNLTHGATVYDYDGQNICLGTCMTKDDTEDAMRQLIFFPNGEVRYNWTYSGSILLKGRE